MPSKEEPLELNSFHIKLILENRHKKYERLLLQDKSDEENPYNPNAFKLVFCDKQSIYVLDGGSQETRHYDREVLEYFGVIKRVKANLSQFKQSVYERRKLKQQIQDIDKEIFKVIGT